MSAKHEAMLGISKSVGSRVSVSEESEDSGSGTKNRRSNGQNFLVRLIDWSKRFEAKSKFTTTAGSLKNRRPDVDYMP